MQITRSRARIFFMGIVSFQILASFMVQAARRTRAKDSDYLHQRNQKQAGGVHNVELADVKSLHDGDGSQTAAAGSTGHGRVAEDGDGGDDWWLGDTRFTITVEK